MLRFLAIVLVLFSTAGCGDFGLQSGHFDDLAEQEPVMANYEPTGSALSSRSESDGDGSIGFGPQRMPQLRQLFKLDDPPESDEQARAVIREVLLTAAADAEAAGWEMDEPQSNGLRLRGRFDNSGSAGGYWRLALSSSSYPHHGLKVSITYYAE